MTKANHGDARYRETRAIHWIMVFIFFLLSLVTDFLLNLVTNAEQRIRVHNLHISLGLTFVILLAFRLFWFRRHRALRAGFDFEWQRKFAMLNYMILYTLMILLISTGIISTITDGDTLRFFDLFTYYPPEFLIDKDIKYYARESHRYLTNITFGFLFFHIIGALNHYFEPMKWKVFNRMK